MCDPLKYTEKYLNVGCGTKFDKRWVNVDLYSGSPYVECRNVLNGFGFADYTFDVVYHSQVLEHMPKDKAEKFIQECFRVLKRGGVCRIVVPDLEGIVTEYLKYLNQNLGNPTEISRANYEWILLELLDQFSRDHSGGEMAKYLRRDSIVNESYVLERIGLSGKKVIEGYRNPQSNAHDFFSRVNKIRTMGISKFIRLVINKINSVHLTKAAKVGAFMCGGELHMWMYDRYSLSRLLRSVGFDDIKIVDPFTSRIPNWDSFELDVKDGNAYDPTSLFVEAIRS